MRAAYFEMIGGASGNMLLGALVDAGANLESIQDRLRTLPIDGWEIRSSRLNKRGIDAMHMDVLVHGRHAEGTFETHDHPHRTLRDVLDIVEASGLRDVEKELAGKIYTRLAQAEARIHGSSVHDVHFHEVGDIDAILDIAGFVVGLGQLGIERVYCSPFPMGRGPIKMHHGTYPNPPPATLEMLRGFPIVDCDVNGEMVTTTAAAILTTVTSSVERPSMTVESVGYGAGSADFAIPNVTRMIIGEISEAARSDIWVLEANIDDMSPQLFEIAMERLFEAGASDVWVTPIVMKKSRPAFMLSAIVPIGRVASCEGVFLRETTTIGLRKYPVGKATLPREIRSVSTRFGEVRVKDVRFDDGARAAPEYDDVARIARELRVPMNEVLAEVYKCL